MDNKKIALILAAAVLTVVGLFMVSRGRNSEAGNSQASIAQGASQSQSSESPIAQKAVQQDTRTLCQQAGARDDPMISPEDRKKMQEPITDSITSLSVPIKLETGRKQILFPEDMNLTSNEVVGLWGGLWNGTWMYFRFDEGGQALFYTSYYDCYKYEGVRYDISRNGIWKIDGEKVRFNSRYINETYHSLELDIIKGKLWMPGGNPGETAEINGVREVPFFKLGL